MGVENLSIVVTAGALEEGEIAKNSEQKDFGNLS
jgi:hypothetical protein